MPSTKALFNEKIQEIFLGSPVSGSGGFVNLVSIKHTYFNNWFDNFLNEIDTKLTETKNQDFENDLYNHLLNFISSNFNDAGNIFFEKTRVKDKISEKIYNQNEDVFLFWKTHNLYYVKNDIVRVEDGTLRVEIDSNEYTFKFDASSARSKNNNEKLYVRYELDTVGDSEITFKIDLSTSEMPKTVIKEIIDKLEHQNIPIQEKQLKGIFNNFSKQITTDFFICKDAGKFLKDQFEEYFRNYIFDLKTEFDGRRIEQFKILRSFTMKFIEFVAYFEEELVKIWEKPKFAIESNFIITFDKIQAKGDPGKEAIRKIISDEGFADQKTEWEQLATCENWESSYHTDGVVNDDYQHLAVDTKHFSDETKYQILALFDNLDSDLDGWLINSDNFQALNTLKEKFAGKIKCTYIDPPFNSPKSKTVYINSWEEAPWLTLIHNRIEAGKSFLDAKKGVLIAAIDKNEQEVFGLLLKKLFPDYSSDCITVVHNPKGTQTSGGFSYTHENAYFVYPEGLKFSKHMDPTLDNRQTIPKANWFDRSESLSVHGTANGAPIMRATSGETFYGIKIKDNEIIDKIFVDDTHHPSSSCEENTDGSYVLWPIDDVGERKWRLKPDTLDQRIALFGSEYVKIETDDAGKPTDIKLANPSKEWKTVWDAGGRYDAGEHGTKLLRKKMGLPLEEGSNLFPKSVWTVYDSLHSVIKNDKEAYVLDYFGGGGTTAHATMILNKKDQGKRKFILVEQGEYFYSIILPRIKKSAFAVNVVDTNNTVEGSWKDGKPTNKEGIGIFVKYYRLEQYEDILSKSDLYTAENPPQFSTPEDYTKYIFKDEPNLVPSANTTLKAEHFETIYSKIDLAETLSYVKAKMIKSLEKNKVIFADDEEINFDSIDFNDIKSLIWW